MLGKLAKWLRVLGYDTCYQNAYQSGELYQQIREGRVLISRDFKMISRYPNAVVIHEDGVGRQIIDLKDRLFLKPDMALWFTRCLRCNTILKKVISEEAMDAVPEYVFHMNRSEISLCDSCGRFYWPGTHRKRMIHQLKIWGFPGKNSA